MAEKEMKGQQKKNSKNLKQEETSETEIVPRLLNVVAWLTGVIVSLSVGFGMIGGTLTLPSWLGGNIVAMVAGWIVVVTTLAGVVLAIFNR